VQSVSNLLADFVFHFREAVFRIPRRAFLQPAVCMGLGAAACNGAERFALRSSLAIATGRPRVATAGQSGLEWPPDGPWIALPPPGSDHHPRRFPSRHEALRWALLRPEASR
jgi:hypothetical protein